ncbi:MAG: peptide chain release factor N(5)-glutamine methyltransferase [Alphaproteobacteria bacterium]|nr:peptide chain release factor N(5)-glutamine methyltransferase [Alphaproteobacteria bacterium]
MPSLPGARADARCTRRRRRLAVTGGIGERSRRAASGAEAGPSGRRDPADVDSSDRAPADEDRADRAPATVGAALCAGAARLAASARWQRGDLDAADAKGDARALLAGLLGVEPRDLPARARAPLGQADAGRFMALVAGRCQGAPVSRLLGQRGFWTLDLAVGPATLDPRPDSETLVEAALAALPDRAAPLRVLDLGTGTGCLLLALLSERPAASGWGIDLAADAVAVARANARSHGLAARAHFAQGDFRRPDLGPPDDPAWDLAARFDVVLTNPPYIPSGDIAGLAPEVSAHDPRLALDGGDDGLAAYRALALTLPAVLADAGWAFIELGDGQAEAVAACMAAAGMHVIGTRPDLGARQRCLLLRAPRAR